MSRQILCKSCGDKWKMHPEDVQAGWQFRMVHLSIKKPDDHGIGLPGDGYFARENLPSIICDTCGTEIPDGTIALAVSMWRESWMIPWEEKYGSVLPEDAVKMINHLTK